MIFLLTSISVLLVTVYLSLRLYRKEIKAKMIKLFLKPYDPNWKIKKRTEIIEDLKSSEFDVLIIGGGCSGVGCALDAASRGLKVGLIESDDFGSGTSSKSSKLLHGGVRYLEKAINDLDCKQFCFVSDALNERKIVMDACPYLTKSIEIMFPVYKRIMIIYYYIGLKIYDWMSGSQSLGPSRFLNREDTIKTFSNIRKDGLKGSIVYKDGQFDDAKYCVMIALTSAYFGASILNHCQFKRFIKENGKIKGVIAFDKISKKELTIKTKTVINTTGQFADKIRQLAENDDKKILAQSSGTHVIVSKEFGPTNMGFVDPNTSDGRLAFFIPFKGKLLMGGTDIRYKEESYVKPNEEDLKFLIHEIDFYTNRNTFVNKNDIFSVWTGIRPLIKDDSKEFTEEIVRKHSILVDKDGLITCTGGKWTIYRLMAEEAIDILVSTFKLQTKRGCVTRHIKLLGAQKYSEKTIDDIKTSLRVSYDVAEHLATSYGTRALLISNYIKERPSSFVSEYPFIKEEILYQMEHEMAFKITDVLFNRFMISYIDVRTAFHLVEIVGKVMKDYYNWSEDYYKEQCEEAKVFLNTAGYSLLNTTEIEL